MQANIRPIELYIIDSLELLPSQGYAMQDKSDEGRHTAETMNSTNPG